MTLEKDKDSAMSIPKLGPVVAIDGPAGTGKSSATRRLAEALGYVHIDTGALYRAVAFLTSEQLKSHLVNHESEQQKAAEVAKNTHLEFRRIPGKNPSNRIFGNGRDLTDYIRTPEMSMAASRVSANPEVRAALLGLQRRLGCMGKAILEGRDIGTVVFPDAELKIYMTASAEMRAQRRYDELVAKGDDVTYEDVLENVQKRDYIDTHRDDSPLVMADDAIEIDNSYLNREEQFKAVLELVEEITNPE
jgi:cytidylate kinase